MSSLLAEYEARLQTRARLSGAEMLRLDDDGFVGLKFTPNGEIKPLYGLTCITWVKAQSQLYQQLCAVKNTLQTTLSAAGLGHFFTFLEPNSYHMTICDICASPTPLTSDAVSTIRRQIEAAWAETPATESITAQVRGVGLTSTISALVGFEQEVELQKVLHLENKIKQATHVDERNFLGHITLAYGVTSPKDQIEHIREVLQPYRDHLFGAIEISKFDLTCFTDMNTFIPLNTIYFQDGQITSHPNLAQCQCQQPDAPIERQTP